MVSVGAAAGFVMARRVSHAPTGPRETLKRPVTTTTAPRTGAVVVVRRSQSFQPEKPAARAEPASANHTSAFVAA